MVGIHLLGIADTVQLGMLIGAATGMVFCNLIIYILHLFLSFKFGLGLSLFWGVFDGLTFAQQSHTACATVRVIDGRDDGVQSQE